ncbi:MAG: SDR family NAD(P)-dependent oxidoreductase, partial [Steroidobacteraceae bacterium]|nr:SDR family NAD(P)-dependent oxidoreductase [Steroidobacteraceae bacterium]
MNLLDPAHSAIAREFRPSPAELRDRVVLVTGAGSGIGKAVAIAAAQVGAQLVLCGRSVRRLEETWQDIKRLGAPDATIAPLDLETALAPQYEDIAGAIERRFGRLDGLVHCAAQLGLIAPLAHYDVPTFYKVMHVNVTAAFALTKVLLPSLERSADASVI